MGPQFKTFIGTKMVKAAPMGANDARNFGANISEEVIYKNVGNNGYLIEYPDGYRSWSPAKIFEKSYDICETYIDRLNIELSKLVNRIIEDTKEAYLCIAPDYQDRDLLLRQIEAMSEYANILNMRLTSKINMFQKKEETL